MPAEIQMSEATKAALAVGGIETALKDRKVVWGERQASGSPKGSPISVSLLSSPEELSSLTADSDVLEDDAPLSRWTSEVSRLTSELEDFDIGSLSVAQSVCEAPDVEDDLLVLDEDCFNDPLIMAAMPASSCGPSRASWDSLLSDDSQVEYVVPPANAALLQNSLLHAGPRDKMLAGGGAGAIRLEGLVLKQVIGRGQYGHVRMVEDPATGTVYALKVIPKGMIAGRKQEEQVVNECRAMSLLDSPFCIRLYGAYQNHDALFFLLEWVGGGQLLHHLDVAGSFTPDTARFYVASLLLALQHVHSLGLVYRDVKPENIVLDNCGYLRLLDFGFAKLLPPERTFTFCGTTEYQAPEVIRGTGGTGREADCWGVGVLIYELLVGVTPFTSRNRNRADVYQRIVQARYRIPSSVPADAADLITRLLKVNREERLGSGRDGVGEIMKHAWFAGFDWAALAARSMKAPIVPRVRSARDVRHCDVYPEVPVPAYASTSEHPTWDSLWEWTAMELPNVIHVDGIDSFVPGSGPRVVTLK